MQEETEDLSDGHGADDDDYNDQDGANLHYHWLKSYYCKFK